MPFINVGKQSLRSCQRLTATFLILCLIPLNNLSYASSVPVKSSEIINFKAFDLATLAVPEDFGKIEATFTGSTGKTVVLIQDAHEIPDAQKNIQRLIDYFQKNYGINLVGLEGANARLDAQIFKSFPDKEALKKVFKEYQERGELAAGAGAAIFGREGADYEGVEDWPLYEEGVGLYLQAMKKEPEALEKIKDREEKLSAEKEKVYSPELLDLEKTVENFYRNHGTMLETLKKLAEVKAPAPGSELALILKESQAQASEETLELEVKKVAHKIDLFLKSKAMDEAGKKRLAEFNSHYQDFKTSRMPAKAFALFMKKLTARDRLPFKISKLLSSSMKDQRRVEEIKGTKFFEDFEHYADEVRDSIIRNNDERKLGKESRDLRLLERLAKLELSREDWNEIKTSVGAPLAGARNNGSRLDSGQAQGLPLQLFSSHFAFYQNSEKRDAAFMKNLGILMQKKRAISAVLVAGGFHTEGLIRRLKDQGISYVRLMPNIQSIPEDTHYRDHMKGDVSWKKYLKAENGRINLYNAFVRGTRDKLLAGLSSPNVSVGDPRAADPRLLKNWRDQIIIDLANKNKVEQAGRYTTFIDEAAGIAPNPREKIRAEWMANIERFADGLRSLQANGQLTRDNLLNLLKPSTITTAPVSSGAQAVPGTNVPGDFFTRSEWRENPVSGLVEAPRSEERIAPLATKSEVRPKKIELVKGLDSQSPLGKAQAIAAEIFKNNQEYSRLLDTLMKLRKQPEFDHTKVQKSEKTPLEYWESFKKERANELGISEKEFEEQFKFNAQVTLIPTTESFRRHILKVDVGGEEPVYLQFKIPGEELVEGQDRSIVSENDFLIPKMRAEELGEKSRFARPLAMVEASGTLRNYYGTEKEKNFDAEAGNPLRAVLFEYRDGKRMQFSSGSFVQYGEEKVLIGKHLLEKILARRRQSGGNDNEASLKQEIIREAIQAGAQVLDSKAPVLPFFVNPDKRRTSSEWLAQGKKSNLWTQETDYSPSNFSLAVDVKGNVEVIVEGDFENSTLLQESPKGQKSEENIPSKAGETLFLNGPYDLNPRHLGQGDHQIERFLALSDLFGYLVSQLMGKFGLEKQVKDIDTKALFDVDLTPGYGIPYSEIFSLMIPDQQGQLQLAVPYLFPEIRNSVPAEIIQKLEQATRAEIRLGVEKTARSEDRVAPSGAEKTTIFRESGIPFPVIVDDTQNKPKGSFGIEEDYYQRLLAEILKNQSFVEDSIRAIEPGLENTSYNDIAAVTAWLYYGQGTKRLFQVIVKFKTGEEKTFLFVTNPADPAASEMVNKYKEISEREKNYNRRNGIDPNALEFAHHFGKETRLEYLEPNGQTKRYSVFSLNFHPGTSYNQVGDWLEALIGLPTGAGFSDFSFSLLDRGLNELQAAGALTEDEAGIVRKARKTYDQNGKTDKAVLSEAMTLLQNRLFALDEAAVEAQFSFMRKTFDPATGAFFYQNDPRRNNMIFRMVDGKPVFKPIDYDDMRPAQLKAPKQAIAAFDIFETHTQNDTVRPWVWSFDTTVDRGKERFFEAALKGLREIGSSLLLNAYNQYQAEQSSQPAVNYLRVFLGNKGILGAFRSVAPATTGDKAFYLVRSESRMAPVANPADKIEVPVALAQFINAYKALQQAVDKVYIPKREDQKTEAEKALYRLWMIFHSGSTPLFRRIKILNTLMRNDPKEEQYTLFNNGPSKDWYALAYVISGFFRISKKNGLRDTEISEDALSHDYEIQERELTVAETLPRKDLMSSEYKFKPVDGPVVTINANLIEDINVKEPDYRLPITIEKDEADSLHKFLERQDLKGTRIKFKTAYSRPRSETRAKKTKGKAIEDTINNIEDTMIEIEVGAPTPRPSNMDDDMVEIEVEEETPKPKAAPPKSKAKEKIKKQEKEIPRSKTVQEATRRFQEFVAEAFVGDQAAPAAERAKEFVATLDDETSKMLIIFLKKKGYIPIKNYWPIVLNTLFDYPPGDKSGNFKRIMSNLAQNKERATGRPVEFYTSDMWNRAVLKALLTEAQLFKFGEEQPYNDIVTKILAYVDGKPVTINGETKTFIVTDIGRFLQIMTKKGRLTKKLSQDKSKEGIEARKKELQGVLDRLKKSEKAFRDKATPKPRKATKKEIPKSEAAPPAKTPKPAPAKPAKPRNKMVVESVKFPKNSDIPDDDPMMKFGLSTIERRYNRMTRRLDEIEKNNESLEDSEKPAAWRDLAELMLAAIDREKLMKDLTRYFKLETDPEALRVARILLAQISARLIYHYNMAKLANKKDDLEYRMVAQIDAAKELSKGNDAEGKRIPASNESELISEALKAKEAFAKAARKYEDKEIATGWKFFWNIFSFNLRDLLWEDFNSIYENENSTAWTNSTQLNKTLDDLWTIKKAHPYVDLELIRSLEAFYTSVRRVADQLERSEAREEKTQQARSETRRVAAVEAPPETPAVKGISEKNREYIRAGWKQVEILARGTRLTPQGKEKVKAMMRYLAKRLKEIEESNAESDKDERQMLNGLQAFFAIYAVKKNRATLKSEKMKDLVRKVWSNNFRAKQKIDDINPERSINQENKSLKDLLEQYLETQKITIVRNPKEPSEQLTEQPPAKSPDDMLQVKAKGISGQNDVISLLNELDLNANEETLERVGAALAALLGGNASAVGEFIAALQNRKDLALIARALIPHWGNILALLEAAKTQDLADPAPQKAIDLIYPEIILGWARSAGVLDEIIKLAAAGKNASDIAASLKETHNLEISQDTIREIRTILQIPPVSAPQNGSSIEKTEVRNKFMEWQRRYKQAVTDKNPEEAARLASKPVSPQVKEAGHSPTVETANDRAKKFIKELFAQSSESNEAPVVDEFMGKIQSSGPMKDAILTEVVQLLINSFVSDPNAYPTKDLRIMLAFMRIGEAAIPALIKALQGQAIVQQVGAARALYNMWPENPTQAYLDTVPALIGELKPNIHPSVLKAIGRTILKFAPENEGFIDHFQAFLGLKDAQISKAASEVLAEAVRASTRAADAMIKAANDGSSPIQKKALEILTNIVENLKPITNTYVTNDKVQKMASLFIQILSQVKATGPVFIKSLKKLDVDDLEIVAKAFVPHWSTVIRLMTTEMNTRDNTLELRRILDKFENEMMISRWRKNNILDRIIELAAAGDMTAEDIAKTLKSERSDLNKTDVNTFTGTIRTIRKALGIPAIAAGSTMGGAALEDSANEGQAKFKKWQKAYQEEFAGGKSREEAARAATARIAAEETAAGNQGEEAPPTPTNMLDQTVELAPAPKTVEAVRTAYHQLRNLFDQLRGRVYGMVMEAELSSKNASALNEEIKQLELSLKTIDERLEKLNEKMGDMPEAEWIRFVGQLEVIYDSINSVLSGFAAVYEIKDKKGVPLTGGAYSVAKEKAERALNKVINEVIIPNTRALLTPRSELRQQTSAETEAEQVLAEVRKMNVLDEIIRLAAGEGKGDQEGQKVQPKTAGQIEDALQSEHPDLSIDIREIRNALGIPPIGGRNGLLGAMVAPHGQAVERFDQWRERYFAARKNGKNPEDAARDASGMEMPQSKTPKESSPSKAVVSTSSAGPAKTQKPVPSAAKSNLQSPYVQAVSERIDDLIDGLKLLQKKDTSDYDAVISAYERMLENLEALKNNPELSKKMVKVIDVFVSRMLATELYSAGESVNSLGDKKKNRLKNFVAFMKLFQTGRKDNKILETDLDSIIKMTEVAEKESPRKFARAIIQGRIDFVLSKQLERSEINDQYKRLFGKLNKSLKGKPLEEAQANGFFNMFRDFAKVRSTGGEKATPAVVEIFEKYLKNNFSEKPFATSSPSGKEGKATLPPQAQTEVMVEYRRVWKLLHGIFEKVVSKKGKDNEQVKMLLNLLNKLGELDDKLPVDLDSEQLKPLEIILRQIESVLVPLTGLDKKDGILKVPAISLDAALEAVGSETRFINENIMAPLQTLINAISAPSKAPAAVEQPAPVLLPKAPVTEGESQTILPEEDVTGKGNAGDTSKGGVENKTLPDISPELPAEPGPVSATQSSAKAATPQLKTAEVKGNIRRVLTPDSKELDRIPPRSLIIPNGEDGPWVQISHQEFRDGVARNVLEVTKVTELNGKVTYEVRFAGDNTVKNLRSEFRQSAGNETVVKETALALVPEMARRTELGLPAPVDKETLAGDIYKEIKIDLTAEGIEKFIEAVEKQPDLLLGEIASSLKGPVSVDNVRALTAYWIGLLSELKDKKIVFSVKLPKEQDIASDKSIGLALESAQAQIERVILINQDGAGHELTNMLKKNRGMVISILRTLARFNTATLPEQSFLPVMSKENAASLQKDIKGNPNLLGFGVTSKEKEDDPVLVQAESVLQVVSALLLANSGGKLTPDKIKDLNRQLFVGASVEGILHYDEESGVVSINRSELRRFVDEYKVQKAAGASA